MATDYKVLTMENIREYGEGKSHLAFLGQLYSDRTHFILELLQNAEDAGATSVRFVLCMDRLEVRHNGRLFNTEDVRGICSVGKSVKGADLTQIGKFGVGFKSVYAYTTLPQVHSGDEHFEIEHFVRPKAVAAAHVDPGQTLFVFPFDHEEVEAIQAYSEIGTRLGSLDHMTLLFLKNVVQIVWQVHGTTEMTGTLQRTVRNNGEIKHVTIRSASERSEWFLFARPLTEYAEHLSVEIAFKLRRDADEELHIEPIPKAPLVAFFPTEKETHVGFLIQGPYRTTPARDNIPHNNQFNRMLVDETGVLIIEALGCLRRQGLLTIDVLECLPIWAMDFPSGSMFRQLFVQLQTAFETEELIPCEDGSFAMASQCKIARGSHLRQLLSDRHLSEMLGSATGIKWVKAEISTESRQRVATYLKANLHVEEITPERFAQQVTDEFLAAQGDKWLTSLYLFLDDHKQLVKRTNPSFLPRKFIRLSDNTMAQPFALDGRANVFLPTETSIGFPVIKRNCVTDPKVRAFFLGLGLAEPDLLAEVSANIIPLYRDQQKEITTQEHDGHMRKICAALQSGTHEKRSELKSELKLTPFILSKNSGTGRLAYRFPGQVYLDSESLDCYFNGNADVWLMSECSEIRGLLGLIEWTSLGIAQFPRRIQISSRLPEEERRKLRAGKPAGRDSESKDYDLEGLKFTLNAIDQSVGKERIDRACNLWKLLLEQQKSLSRDERQTHYSGEYRWGSGKAQSENHPAHFVRQLCDSPWVATREGRLEKPKDVSLDELHPDLEPDQQFGVEIGIKVGNITELSKEIGVDPELLKFVRDYQSEIAEFKLALMKRVARQQQQRDQKSFADQIGKTVEAMGVAVGAVSAPDTGVVNNPAFRRERVKEEIENAAKLVSADAQAVSVRTYAPKDEATKRFLLEQYGGRCQMCSFHFRKKNGEPYFEAVYMASRLAVKWADKPGNVLCLCANCSAMYMHGSVNASTLCEQVMNYVMTRDGGRLEPTAVIDLCGRPTTIRFTEKHLLDLQEMIKASINEGASSATV